MVILTLEIQLKALKFGIIMLSKFDEKFLKAVILVLWILPTSILFYILNSVATDDYFVFVCVIFGCNVVYDTSKKKRPENSGDHLFPETALADRVLTWM